jgi:prevent-host-death family protein
MISVGVKELKAKLSSFVARAREGEEIVITDHGKDVALIMPLSRERRVVKSLMEKGKVKWAGGKPGGTAGIRIRGKALSKTVTEDRR